MADVDSELIPEILPSDTRVAFQGSAAELLDIITRAARVAPEKEVISGTSHVLLEAHEASGGTSDYLRASATDGSLYVSALAGDFKVRQGGTILVPGQKLRAILRMVPDSAVAVQVSGSSAIIRSGRSQWTIQLPKGDKLPSAYKLAGIEPVELPRGLFLEALRAAERSASHASARSSLMQVKVEKGHVSGQDGNRVHRFSYEEDSDLDMAIPLATCLEVIEMLEASTDSHFRAGTDGKTLVFSIDKDFVVSSTMLVPFPDVDPILVKASMVVKNELSVHKAELIEAVKRVRVNSDPDFSSLFLGATKNSKGEWGASLRALDRQGNSAQEFLPASWDGPQVPREFCVNHKHLLDLLDSCPLDAITFKVGEDTQSSKSPLLVEADGKFTGLLQQMRSDYLT